MKPMKPMTPMKPFKPMNSHESLSKVLFGCVVCCCCVMNLNLVLFFEFLGLVFIYLAGSAQPALFSGALLRAIGTLRGQPDRATVCVLGGTLRWWGMVLLPPVFIYFDYGVCVVCLLCL